MFPVGSSAAVSEMVLCAMQIHTNMPVVNAEIATRTEIVLPIVLRVTCDSGIVLYDQEPTKMSGDVLNFLKSEREVGVENSVVITERVFNELPSNLRGRFHFLKEFAAVDAKIYQLEGKKRHQRLPHPDWPRVCPFSKLAQT